MIGTSLAAKLVDFVRPAPKDWLSSISILLSRGVAPKCDERMSRARADRLAILKLSVWAGSLLEGIRNERVTRQILVFPRWLLTCRRSDPIFLA